MIRRDMKAPACRGRVTMLAVVFLGSVWASRCCANLAPVVKVVSDTQYAGTKSGGFLAGDVSDDSTPYDSLAIMWTQISGPAQAAILLPASASTSVTFPDSGSYVFELSASDGRLTGRDTLTVRVRVNLPFLLLRPANGESMEMGKRFVIRWQMDPSIACTVWLTINNGRTWSMLTVLGSVRDSFVWQVPDTFAAGTQGGIKVNEYQNGANVAAGSGVFTFVNSMRVVRPDRPGDPGRPFRISVNRGGELRVDGSRDDAVSRIELFDANGTMPGGYLGAPRANRRACTTAIAWYRVVTEAGAVWTGRLPLSSAP